MNSPKSKTETSAERSEPPPQSAIVHLAAEYWPLAQSGGLAEAVRGIARHQAAAGVPTFAFLPLYQNVREAFPEIEPCGEPFSLRIGPRTETAALHRYPSGPFEPQIYLIEHDGYFGRPTLYGEHGGAYPDNHLRFALFCRAALASLPRLSPGKAVVHAHDWHAALAPIYLRTTLAGQAYFDDVCSLLTVHNAGYQGYYGREVLDEVGLGQELYRVDLMGWYGKANLLKGGLVFSDIVTTVSPTHAHELRTRTGGFGLHDTFNELQDRFMGILNGIDYEVWNPETDGVIHSNFGRDDLTGKAACKVWLQDAVGLPPLQDTPLFAMTARLVEQKGLDLILQAKIIPRLDAQWVFLGEGEPRYQEALGRLAEHAPDRIAVRFDFSAEREHRLLAAADFLLMPSLYEPCGLTQMRAQRYGALPVVRRVGGLVDTVDDRITGFVFDEYQPWALEETVQYAIDLYSHRETWESHVREAMGRDFGWARSVDRYAEAYRRAARARRDQTGRG